MLSSDAAVAEAMVSASKLRRAESTVGAMHDLFADDHVHAGLIVEAGVLVAVVERVDLRAELTTDDPAVQAGCLTGRVISPDASLLHTHRLMLATGQRRLAVVDTDGSLLGLLCLKRHHHGFCTDADVQARASQRITAAAGTHFA